MLVLGGGNKRADVKLWHCEQRVGVGAMPAGFSLVWVSLLTGHAGLLNL